MDLISPDRREASSEFPRVGILNDYVRIPYANGSSFASQFLYREFSRRGSEVSVVGPRDPDSNEAELPERRVLLSSLPLRNHPGVHLPFLGRRGVKNLAAQELSIAVGQTSSALMYAGLWLRRAKGVPFVCVNTVHMPSVYEVMLPAALQGNRVADFVFQQKLIPWVERSTAGVYNGGDGLVVLSQGMKDYWRSRGVTVPIHVVPRSVDPEVFDRRSAKDPFPAFAQRGDRLLVACRHTGEKNLIRLLDIFATKILPARPNATLTLVGDGPDHELFKEHARKLNVFDRCVWPGEVGLPDMPGWYRHADLFLYTSLSETYGQVVSEALWCGLPVVAFHDDKGVSDQVAHGADGFLIRPEAEGANADFAARVLTLLGSVEMRRMFSVSGRRRVVERSDPARCVAAYEDVFYAAREHRDSTWAGPASLWSRTKPLLQMALTHALLAVLGCLRKPAVLNRNRQKQPQWDSAGESPNVRRGQVDPVLPAGPGVASAA